MTLILSLILGQRTEGLRQIDPREHDSRDGGHVDTCPFNAGSLTKTALLAQLFQHHYESGSYLFYKELYEVIVDTAHPFRVEIEPARRGYSKATVSLYYKVQKQTFKWYENRTPPLVRDIEF